MSRPDAKRLDDMREMCAVIGRLVSRGRPLDDGSEMLMLALERALEVLGEAANHVSETSRAEYPSIPWPEVTRLRIVLAHHYHRVDFDLLWEIATSAVPTVAVALGPSAEDDDP